MRVRQKLVWGGADECNHEWASIDLSFHKGQVPDGKWKKQTAVSEAGNAVTSTCTLCTAWRGAFGLEPTIEMYVQHTIEILREIRRVLRSDGVCFWNIGDSYYQGNKGNSGETQPSDKQSTNVGSLSTRRGTDIGPNRKGLQPGLKAKDLSLIPQRLALAAQADGWWVRSDILWVKPNPMPESMMDRPTDAYEHILMLTKSATYYWDKEAVAEPTNDLNTKPRNFRKGDASQTLRHDEGNAYKPRGMRNIRNVWTFPTQPIKWPKGQEHFAVFPKRLPQLCILAATSETGCCPKCGTPWKRIVYKSGGRDWKSDRMVEAGIPGELAGEGPYKRGRLHEALNDIKIAKTLGWSLGCKCAIERPVPCLVLDPFGGSGTTAKVALELGRRAISIDLALP